MQEVLEINVFIGAIVWTVNKEVNFIVSGRLQVKKSNVTSPVRAILKHLDTDFMDTWLKNVMKFYRNGCECVWTGGKDILLALPWCRGCSDSNLSRAGPTQAFNCLSTLSYVCHLFLVDHSLTCFLFTVHYAKAVCNNLKM